MSVVPGILAHLLSRIYDGSLAPEHLADLRKSTLTDETIRAQHIRSVPPAMIAPLLGFDISAIKSALLFPFRSPSFGFTDLARIKVFPALTDAAGHSVKYLQPRGSHPRVYFIARCLREVLEGDDPLWIVEGEKKALAIAQLGRPTIGICGVEGWHSRQSCLLLDDFDAIHLKDRVVELLPDSDFQTNPDVRRAVEGFGRALRGRGAHPRVVLLPSELPR